MDYDSREHLGSYMERSTKGHTNVWRYFLILSACALNACGGGGDSCSLTACQEEEAIVSSGNTSNFGPAAQVPVEDSPPAINNNAPSISGTPPQQVTLGTNYFFKPTANDSDGDRLTFSIRNKPVWASFGSTTGELSGTPASGDAGLNTGIVISVSDGVRGAALPPFSIEIITAVPPIPAQDPPPGASEEFPPEISGAPMELAAVNQLYFFQPFASDLDGDQLEFSIVNKPSWLGFDSLSGAISGIPTAADVGSYGGIWINVSDGLNGASLGPFDIEVVAIGQDSVTLSWLPPTENEDGSPLMDLAGYRLRYGSNANSYPNLIDINNPGIVTFSVENLVPNTYYFVITAYNSSGVESTFSNQATMTLN